MIRHNKVFSNSYYCNVRGFYFVFSMSNRGILGNNICLISISNLVFDGVTNKSGLNIERS